MSQKKTDVISDQMKFFNENAGAEKPVIASELILNYANKEQVDGFNWLKDRRKILDYGCGTGTSIQAFKQYNPVSTVQFVGIDIAEAAIKKVKMIYPEYDFFTIQNNQISQLKTGDVDGAYLLHVLHHSVEHREIFQEIYEKLAIGGKFFLSDLSSNNPIILLFRELFILAPKFIKQRFSDDLVVDNSIPEKYKVNLFEVIEELKAVGFKIEKVEYGHLFFFAFGWLDRFMPLTKMSFFRSLYLSLWKLEDKLLKIPFFQKYAEVFCIKCTK